MARSLAAALYLVLALSSWLGSETLTLSTYYPSPLGVYRELVTTGTTGVPTLLARDGGRVGVAVSAPQAVFHAAGRSDGVRVARFDGGANDPGVRIRANRGGDYAVDAENLAGAGWGGRFVGNSLGAYGFAQNGWGGHFIGRDGALGSATGGGTGLEGAASGGMGVFGHATSGTGVRGQSATGWSGQFLGGKGLFADQILSSRNKIPIGMGIIDTGDPNFYAVVAKPACPAGYTPRILAGLAGTRTGGDVDDNDFIGVQAWSESASFFGVYAADCDRTDCRGGGPVYMRCTMGSSRAAAAWYITYCVQGGAFTRFGGCCGFNNWCP